MDARRDVLFENFEEATIARLHGQRCTPAILRAARRDAIDRRLDGAAVGIAADFDDVIQEYVDDGWQLTEAQRVCPEAMLSGYWTGRRVLGTDGETYAWTEAEQDRIGSVAVDLEIEEIVALSVKFDDETNLLYAIAPGVDDDGLSYPMISFDIGFTAAIVEYDLAHTNGGTP